LTLLEDCAVGGGTRFFPQGERKVDLGFGETSTFNSKVGDLRDRVVRQERGPTTSPTT
jgi:hypothetical protein